MANGWVGELYLAPRYHLTYPGFGWVRPVPAPWMHLVVGLSGAAGVAIALGWRCRAACAVFLAAFGYLELIEATLYLNHYWFVTLCAALLLIVPTHHRWSLDARAGRVRASPVVAAPVLWALRGQVAAVYVFAGLAKLNGDWLGSALPLRLWLADRAGVPLIGPLLGEPWVAYVASWAGAAFDCTIVIWLLWRRSRSWALGVLVVFHLVTGVLFAIGVFPLLMAPLALVFFEPDWPQRFANWFSARVPARLATRARALGKSIADASPPAPVPASAEPALRGWRAAALLAFAVVGLALPLRHLAYEGNVRWTEEGYWGAWRVMLTDKAGHLEFRVTHPPSGRAWQVGPELVLEDWQTERAAGHPSLIGATAHLIARHYERIGWSGVEVRADAWVSMNGRPAQRIIDPTVDLAAQPRSLGQLVQPSPWILHLPN